MKGFQGSKVQGDLGPQALRVVADARDCKA